MVAFLRPVRVAKRQVVDGQVPRCVLSRTLVRSRERDLCFREKKITSFSMEQTSAPGLGGARGWAPAPPGLDSSARRAPTRRAGPTFVSQKNQDIAAFETNIRPLSPPRPRPLCGGPLPVLQVRVPSCVLSVPGTGLSPCPLTLWDDAFPTEDCRHPALTRVMARAPFAPSVSRNPPHAQLGLASLRSR
jgi:hypothetical protein